MNGTTDAPDFAIEAKVGGADLLRGRDRKSGQERQSVDLEALPLFVQPLAVLPCLGELVEPVENLVTSRNEDPLLLDVR